MAGDDRCPSRGDRPHAWHWYSDGPYLVCHHCREIRDALNGRVIRPAQTVGADDA